jgi:hypothetical protein
MARQTLHKGEAKSAETVDINRLKIENENYYKISNYNEMRPFFMSIVSDSNHWMFISSNGALSAGRKNSNYSLFPYYTSDKITESVETTGSKSIFQVTLNNELHIWEPFSERNSDLYNTTRNLYKNALGNKIIFEEINHDLGLTFKYQWNSSNEFGFVRKSQLTNHSDAEINVSVLDGIQNLMPEGVGPDLQNSTSNLVDAYKRNELNESSGLGIYALSAIIVDKAEPSEALKANVAWSLGLPKATHLVSSMQVGDFRKGLQVKPENDVKAEKGAYFINAIYKLAPNAEETWTIVADVNKSQSAIVALIEQIKTNKNLAEEVHQNIQLGSQKLIELNASADGIQLSADVFRDSRHFSNSLFNIMRGGVFDANYQIEKWDFKNYIQNANTRVYTLLEKTINALPETFTSFDLEEVASKSSDKDFKRLCKEYMPLKFSRRHGDPSRPWNKFSINTRSEVDGSKILDYEGNWRDIFQNWEALAHSYPAFTESMIHKFLNATTFEGYNPYRVTKGGFDWETIEPDNPWSYIGYWGDHQIIYLLKLLELNEKYFPGQLATNFEKEAYVYADVPYKIKSYEEIVKNPKDTIEFDEELDLDIRARRKELGSDAALLIDENDAIYTVNYVEKILATVLAKLSNFIPEGGIWMNTQRPEWNDANNALVGNGVSMVTLYYLRRFLIFFDKQIENATEDRVEISNELIIFYKKILETFEDYQHVLKDKISDKHRKEILDHLGQAGSDYREHIYKQAFWGQKRTISYKRLKRFIKLSLKFIEHTIKANKREDKLYHAYNLMTVENDKEVSIAYLDEMLEGQVAVLSSGHLKPKKALRLLDSMKKSALFREDQYSYILYPNKNLPKFLEKNNVPAQAIKKSKLLTKMEKENDTSIIEKDTKGNFHFNGNFKNANDLASALHSLDVSLDSDEEQHILATFEKVFNHKAFTGRSGTFFGYEGLGSIYWHMVSKLQLAVQEICLMAVEKGESKEIVGRLLEHYYEINEGVGVHKSPQLYGAFPTDPYSHTPAGRGAQQPGMTGQVKEDVLSRFGELGVFVKDGCLYFDPCLLRKNEFTVQSRNFHYVDVHMNHHDFSPELGSLCFTYCQVPIIYRLAKENSMVVTNKDKTSTTIEGLNLDAQTSSEIFKRSGEVVNITVYLDETSLK